VICYPQKKTPIGFGGHAIIPIMIGAGVVISQLFPPFARLINLTRNFVAITGLRNPLGRPTSTLLKAGLRV